MDTSKKNIGIPPPKFHGFAICGCGVSDETNLSSSLWEIGVPMKNSIIWSIVLSYLYLSSDSDFKESLQKLTGDENEVGAIMKKKNMCSKPLDIDAIKQELKSFNPFKYRSVLFQQVKEVFRIFRYRLVQHLTKFKKKDESNRVFVLNAASLFLKSEIEVHFPSETDNPTIATYPKSQQKYDSKITLFQYNDQQDGSGSQNYYVFRFGMPDQKANPLKLDALKHFLKEAEISTKYIAKIEPLMEKSENHGKSFLTTILKNGCHKILQKIYRSPYIAHKISEAGFETDPLECSAEKLSVFCQSVLSSKDPKYLSILYDYVSNCRSLLDHSVRRASDNVLESLCKIKSLLEKDVRELELSTHENSEGSSANQRPLVILKQFITYSEYQINVASDLNDLKKNFKLETAMDEDKFQFRKSVVKSILKRYQNHFYYNLVSQPDQKISISDKFINYLHFSEYYKNADSFGCLSFFDNFYQLRILIDLKEENFFLRIEWKMFVAVLFNYYFPKCDHETEGNRMNPKNEFLKVNVLRYVPLLHRNVLETEISTFLEILENSSDSETLQKSIKRENSATPLIIDTLLKIRIQHHIKAALEVSTDDGNIKSILAIERALQVIGESIKPSSLSNSIISFLLRSCLPFDLQENLIFIRNYLSHLRCNSAYIRLKTEQNFAFFEKIQNEIKTIKQHFKIVFFTQYLRIEESSMLSCISEIGSELPQDIRKAFYEKYNEQVDKRVEMYETKHDKCVKLLFDTLTDLQNHIGITKIKNVLIDQLKAVDYLLNFISKHTKSVEVLKELKTALDCFVSKSKDVKMKKFKNGLHNFLSEWINTLKQNNITGRDPISAPKIKKFSKLLKSDLFLIDEETKIKYALQKAYEESIAAINNLQNLLWAPMGHSDETKNLETWLKRIFIPLDKIHKIRNYFNSKKFRKAYNLVKKNRFSKDQFEKDISEMFHPKNGPSPYFMILLTKITYQKYLSSPIYTHVQLSDIIFEKLEFFLTKSAHIVIARMKSLKSILIDEDDEIEETLVWGKSKEIKHHMKFLMRKRYMRDNTVRASLDMAFFDCLNILKNNTLFTDLYEKTEDLFSGIDLRNVIAHRTNIPETIGGLLDEDDFPSTMIEKMLELIDDLEAVESILYLFTKSGSLDEKEFINWIKTAAEKKYKDKIDIINKCSRWENYLFLFPFIKDKL